MSLFMLSVDFLFFFFKQKTAYEISACLVGSEMCIRDRNWTQVRQIAGYHRYDTAAELELLNRIWTRQTDLTNFFYPQQKLIAKERVGAKVIKRYDTATTPHRRAIVAVTVTKKTKTALTR